MASYNIIFITIVVMILVKIYNVLTCGIYNGKDRLDGKTVVITGANAGIGMECAKDFAKRGARIIMACRDVKKAMRVKDSIVAATGNENMIIKHVDFKSLVSVRKCANEIVNEEPKIDILLNNAGSLGIGFEQTSDGLDELMQVNHFSPFLFTNILLGKLKKSESGRIVYVSSVAYLYGQIDFDHLAVVKPQTYAALYSNTKLANIHISNELAHRLKGTGVTVNSLHPGVFVSGINRECGTLYATGFYLFAKLFCKNVVQAAHTSIFLCVSPDVKGVTGKFFQDCKMTKLWNGADDMGVAKKLWEASEEIVKLQASERHY